MNALTAAAEKLEWTKLQNLAHEIGGAAGMYGYHQCRIIAKELQNAAKEQARAKVPELVKQLRDVSQAVILGQN